MTSEMATDLRGLVVKRVADSIILYADFTDLLAVSGATISSVVVTCPDDATLTIASSGVVTSQTNVPSENEAGEVVTRTIAANKGVKATIGAGTAQAEGGDPIRILWKVTLSTGEIIQRGGRLRVE